MSKSSNNQNSSGKKPGSDQKKVKTEFLISKNIKSDSINFQPSTREDSIIKTDNKILSDFLNRLENLVLQENEEIPSFTRIYHKEELISETFNEVEKKSDSYFHSEILCIRKAKEKLKTRYLMDCMLITSLEPCLMCAGTILLSRIPKVIYLLPAKQGEGISSLSIEMIYSRNFFPELFCIPVEISKNAFKSFFKARRKKFN
ncbi:nucleoside deaminase [Leptospira kirschneri]|uniref:Cytidine and deoxycytidylate deaminase zinc-binding region n=1 Tax=Leptospira kirschneri str. 200802841 TaxID=1193047 RepID=A0A828XYT2_9LEPT|nr:nucleoside deaminase [Leptospira kirschneri]EMO76199.1 cytidine and deoxycytidylate deaminase zinc-binding region [Leptospira kirschneri str. 200801925]EJO69101.1 cytidine and deoxycytidylate deaminase zinc-binding region [Leptospira kirschneri serovar Grippotyphosa str. RM52]EKO50559.1 cytidine and deoxycytidylate deaminase zinc-binding region [Leptospira kirschneri str. 200802841]EKQ83542.1 cytidine and deoxycytidylate deaminase zinc-binding region [Leptospira kirschneri serovar Grippotyph